MRWRIDEALPSGVVCSADIEIPTPDPIQVYSEGSTVHVEGTASVGEAIPVQSYIIASALDVSGSMSATDGCGGDANMDGGVDTRLDCVIAAVTALNTQADELGTVGAMGLAPFGEGSVIADMVPDGGANDPFTGPDTDDGPGGGDGTPDVVNVLSSLDYGAVGEFTPFAIGSFATNCSAGLTEMAAILGASALPNQIGVFVSDGGCNAGANVSATIAGFTFPVHTFAIGNVTCDTNPTGRGSMQDIADGTGGTCTEVPDVSDLPNILPALIMSQLTDLELSISGTITDGGAAYGPFGIDPIDLVTPMVPPAMDGPASLIFEHDLDGLEPGTYSVCVEAFCTDESGNVDPDECSTFRINAPPVVVCNHPTVPANDECLAEIEKDQLFSASDPDGDSLSCSFTPSGPFGPGTHDVEVTCYDGYDQTTEICTVTVEDVTPPVVEVVPESLELWPPNHSYHQIPGSACIAEITDNCDGALDPDTAWAVDTGTSDEAERATGSGNTCNDIVLDELDPTFVEVRSERIGGGPGGPGDGRVYGIEYSVSDTAGNTFSATCTVTVPHDQSGDPAVDSDCAYCVGANCGACPNLAPTCD